MSMSAMRNAFLCCVIVLWGTMATAVSAREIVDDLGEKFQFASAPQRIVSLAPSNTELLFALGVGDRIVGVTEYCNYPPEVASIEKVAGFNTVNLEKIAAASPDLIFAIRGNDMESLRSLRQLGVPVFSLDIQTLEQVDSALRRLGSVMQVESRAKELADSLSARIRGVEQRVGKISTKPKVMWGFWGDPVYTAGKGTMIDDVIAVAGGRNVGRLAEGAWPQVGLETIVMWAPDVIITTHIPGGVEKLPAEMERLRQTDGWKQLPAVQKGRIYYIEGDWLLRPGPRLVDALEGMARHLHPQLSSP
jgi:iron complex transport system substrate-binding protein